MIDTVQITQKEPSLLCEVPSLLCEVHSQALAAVLAVVGVEVSLFIAAGASAVLSFLLGGVNHCGRYDTGGHGNDGVTKDHYYT